MQYIDIHTHHDYQSEEVLNIRNFITGKDEIRSDKPFSMGIHPWFLEVDISLLEKSAEENKDNPNWLAVGECGMDYSPQILEKFDKKEQEKSFIRQIQLAEKYNKPLVIHCVRCFDRLLKIKKENQSPKTWIVHGYAKNKALARQLIEADFYLSFGARLFKSGSNREALKNTPLNRIFLETDEQNEYGIREIYQLAAQVKNVSLQKLKIEIYRNFQYVFIP